MDHRARLHLALAALVAACALVPAVAADSGAVTVTSASYRGGARLHGEAAAFYLAQPLDLDGPATGAPGDGAVFGIQVRARQMEALLVESRYLVGPSVAGVTQPIDDPRHATADPPRRIVLEHAQADLVAQQPGLQLHLLPDGAATVPFTADGDAGRFDALQDVSMGPGRFREAQAADPADDRSADRPDFWSVRSAAPMVVHEDQAGRFTATFTGDLVLELLGGTLEAHGRGGQADLESGVWDQAATGSLGLQSTIVERRVVLLRLFLVDADVRITSQGGSPDIYVASPALGAELDGAGTLLGATGSIDSGSGPVSLEEDRYDVPAGTTMQLTPDQGRIALGLAPTTSPSSLGATTGPFAGAAGPWLVVGVIAAGVALAVLALVRRASSPADLRAVEAAIEAQRYGRAARIAKRILRVQPGLEDAVLGRAIALSKAGRAGAAIAEVHAHLARRPASDGSLHYVLGLAFLDVGRSQEARIALAEAVRLTPALANDVQSRLGPEGSSGLKPTSPMEADGYA